jgi:hypothetical protein
MRRSSMRTSMQSTLRRALLAVFWGVSLNATLRGDEWTPPPSGEVRLASGRVVDYTIHFDRNSLRDSLRVGDALIALTSSGALLRFELPAVRLVRERIDDEVVCIGRGEGEAVLAGLADGRVCRVEPLTFALTEVAKLPAAPSWVGSCQARGNRLAGLIGLTRKTRLVERDGERWNEPCSVVHDLATGKTFALEHLATTVLLDGAGRLWLGADNGEFGGHVSRIDLSTGIVTAIKPPPSREPGEADSWDGVYGFIELRDGQVWAYGGTSHMGLNNGEITRIDEIKARTIASFDPPPNPRQEPDPSRPQMPITHIVEENDGLLVFSYSDVFRVDRELKAWNRAVVLEIQYHWGRANAVGAYPAVSAVHPPSREGEPYLLATIGDGYVVLDGPKATPRSIPGQLAAAYVSGIANTSEGILFFEWDDRLPTWRLGAEGWVIAALEPPFEPDPNSALAGFEKKQEGWSRTRVLVGPGGMIYTVSGTGTTPGTRTTSRRVDGKAVRLGRETSSLYPSDSFITADGTLWNAFYREFWWFQNGRWEIVHALTEKRGPDRLEPLNSDGPPWLLHDGFQHDLWRLDHDRKGNSPRLTPLEVLEGGKALAITDAISWSDRSLLLATRLGLRVYSPLTQTLARINFPEPPQRVTVLARDRLGRLWWGSDKGLGLSDLGAKAPEAFDPVPWIGRSHVYALAPDPEHADGIIASLGARGVAFVRARQKP